uniref:Uncharacterized protein n=1 Tax=Pristionchus pacificus TaxID=54126 RepID=A0A2A6BD38_PRIPA|eukprot:PDM63789.1 hypothetical protein PRIPAC_49762 [Pristionchus pacificus]
MNRVKKKRDRRDWDGLEETGHWIAMGGLVRCGTDGGWTEITRSKSAIGREKVRYEGNGDKDNLDLRVISPPLGGKKRRQ